MSEQMQVEVDMGTVQKVFAYASDTIVEASKLRQDFSALRVEVEELREDLTRLRRQNEFMDEQLVNIRRSRDEAHQKIHELEGTLHQRNEHIQVLERDLDDAKQGFEHRTNELNTARQDLDYAQLRVMDLEEETRKQQDFIRQITEKLENVYSILQPKAQPAPVGSGEEPPAVNEADRRPGESEEEHRERTQPRDPVTQQWRSPYGEATGSPTEDCKVA